MKSFSAADGLASYTEVGGVSRHALEEQFTGLLAANASALSRLAASYTDSTTDRDDLLQDIALALWLALPRFRRECSERTFLYRIAHNRCITHLSKKRPVVALDDEQIDPIDPTPRADVRLSQEERGQRLLRAIRRLPVIYRHVIVLTLEGMGYREIAQVLGIGESNVGVRLNRARQLLKKILGESP